MQHKAPEMVWTTRRSWLREQRLSSRFEPRISRGFAAAPLLLPALLHQQSLLKVVVHVEHDSAPKGRVRQRGQSKTSSREDSHQEEGGRRPARGTSGRPAEEGGKHVGQRRVKRNENTREHTQQIPWRQTSSTPCSQTQGAPSKMRLGRTI